MKKCPYCAEDIQDEAKKCKHCGEWLNVSQDGKLMNAAPDAVKEEIKKDEIKTEISSPSSEPPKMPEGKNPEIMGDEDITRYRKIPGSKSLIKRPGIYGWGWLIFLGLLANYNIKHDSFSNAAFSIIWDIFVLLFLILYFWLRGRLIKKWAYARWKPGLVSGLCTYLVAIIVFGAMVFFDTKSIYSTIASVTVKYKDKV